MHTPYGAHVAFHRASGSSIKHARGIRCTTETSRNNRTLTCTAQSRGGMAGYPWDGPQVQADGLRQTPHRIKLTHRVLKPTHQPASPPARLHASLPLSQPSLHPSLRTHCRFCQCCVCRIVHRFEGLNASLSHSSFPIDSDLIPGLREPAESSVSSPPAKRG